MDKNILRGTALLIALSGTAILVAGPLNPPSGPAASTFRTLAEVQPRIPVQSLPGSSSAQYVISQPGSYYLTSSITGVSGKNGIQVAASNVTIDLCGFVMDGGAIGYSAIAAGNVSGLAVRNGSITNWTATGVDAGGAVLCLFESLELDVFGGFGLDTGSSAVVRGCTARGAQTGIVARAGTRLVDCSVASCSVYGVLLSDASSANHCTVTDGLNAGFALLDHNNALVECVVRGGNRGVYVDSGGNRVERCKIGQAPIGIDCYFGNTLVENTINASVAGQGQGIVLFGGNNRAEGNHIFAFDRGIDVSSPANIVVSNTMTSCVHPINSLVAFPMVAPVVTTAAALATDPVANVAQ